MRRGLEWVWRPEDGDHIRQCTCRRTHRKVSEIIYHLSVLFQLFLVDGLVIVIYTLGNGRGRGGHDCRNNGVVLFGAVLL